MEGRGWWVWGRLPPISRDMLSGSFRIAFLGTVMNSAIPPPCPVVDALVLVVAYQLVRSLPLIPMKPPLEQQFARPSIQAGHSSSYMIGLHN